MFMLRTRILTDAFGRRRTAASASKRPAAKAPARATADNKKRTSAFRFMGHLAVGVAPIYHRQAPGCYPRRARPIRPLRDRHGCDQPALPGGAAPPACPP